MVFIVKAFLNDLRYDDGIFYSFTQKYDFLEFLQWRYYSWSGRIVGDGLAYVSSIMGIWFYRIVSMVCLFLTAFSIIRICCPKFDFKIFLFTILLIGGLINFSILTSSIFWFNGFIYYLIPVSFGLYSMIIYADFYFRKIYKNNLLKIFLTFLSIFIAMLSNEQISIVIIVFSFVFHFIYIYKKEKLPKLFYYLTFFSLICLATSLLSPGNKLRIESELHWFPGFDILPISAHIKIGTFLLFDSVVNKLFFIIAALSSIIFTKKKDFNKTIKFIKNIFIIQILFIVVNKLNQSPFLSINFLYNFNFLKITYLETFKLSFSSYSFKDIFIGVSPYIFWALYLINLLILLIYYSKKKYFTFLMFMAGICSIVLLWFSPTMFGSGNRILYVCSIIWITLFVDTVCNSKLLNNKTLFLLLFVVYFNNLFPLYFYWLKEGFKVIY